MRILFAIPHYYGPMDRGFYASERSQPEARAAVVRQCLASLRQAFSEAQGIVDGLQQGFHPANPQLSANVTIALCTTGERHLVNRLSGCGVDHMRTQAEPRHLGFECHKVLRDGLGRYDYFCYLEDDLRIADALFFAKLGWFNRQFGDAAVLQPNRFEALAEPAPCKLYIDGNLRNRQLTEALQRPDGEPRLEAGVFGLTMLFRRVNNPHAGCFFLNAAQLARWAGEADFGVPTSAFCGPLESAATLGIMRHFRVYKPARENAAFLEVEHLDLRYLGRYFQPVGDGRPGLLWG